MHSRSLLRVSERIRYLFHLGNGSPGPRSGDLQYQAGLAKVIEDYSKTGLIIASDLNADYRTEKMGLIEGTVTFIDDSRLFFTEYLDVRFKVEKLTYSFHYQQHNGTLIFRYDNAGHKPRLKFTNHKHTADGVAIEAEAPELTAVLSEIMLYLV